MEVRGLSSNELHVKKNMALGHFSLVFVCFVESPEAIDRGGTFAFQGHGSYPERNVTHSASHCQVRPHHSNESGRFFLLTGMQQFPSLSYLFTASSMRGKNWMIFWKLFTNFGNSHNADWHCWLKLFSAFLPVPPFPIYRRNFFVKCRFSLFFFWLFICTTHENSISIIPTISKPPFWRFRHEKTWSHAYRGDLTTLLSFVCKHHVLMKFYCNAGKTKR